VWALGCILLEMLMGTALWDLDFDMAIKCIEEPSFIYDYMQNNVPRKFDNQIKSLLKKML
jgi:hypothetical protein